MLKDGRVNVDLLKHTYQDFTGVWFYTYNNVGDGFDQHPASKVSDHRVLLSSPKPQI